MSKTWLQISAPAEPRINTLISAQGSYTPSAWQNAPDQPFVAENIPARRALFYVGSTR